MLFLSSLCELSLIILHDYDDSSCWLQFDSAAQAQLSLTIAINRKQLFSSSYSCGYLCIQLHETPYRIGRRPGYQGPRCSTSSSVDSEKSASKKKTKKTTTDNWTMKVRTLLDREGADRPERRTALVTMELAKYNIDIAALCETRFSEFQNTTKAQQAKDK